jgi:hypothetical protein
MRELIRLILREETIGDEQLEKKVCKTCGLLKPISDYRNGRSQCKTCENKIRYEKNKEKRKVDSEYDRWWKEYDVKRKRKKENENPMEKFKQMSRSNDRSAFRRKGYPKNSKSSERFGIEWEGFKKHIENKFVNGMNWDNMGEWELDHIIPLSLAINNDEINELSHYTNRQPLWSEDNILKSDKIFLDTLSNDIKTRYKKFIDRYLKRIRDFINNSLPIKDPCYAETFNEFISWIRHEIKHTILSEKTNSYPTGKPFISDWLTFDEAVKYLENYMMDEMKKYYDENCKEV